MYAFSEGILGTPQPIDVQVPDTTQRFPLGTVVAGTDPFFGFGEFIYVKNGAASRGVGRVSYISTRGYVLADYPNTANLGRPIVVPSAVMAADTYGWVCTRGMRPWSCTASVAAGTAFGITAAGQVGANTAGKQILGAVVIEPSTFAPTMIVSTQQGSPFLDVYSIDGLFIGLPISGAGIPGGATIAGLNPNQNQIQISANATATGQVTATTTWTGFLLVNAGPAHAQGAIT